MEAEPSRGVAESAAGGAAPTGVGAAPTGPIAEPAGGDGYTGPLPPERFNMAAYCLAGAAARAPHKTGLIVVHDADAPVEGAEHWTYAGLDRAVRAIAAGLHARGLQPGDRVMIRMGNTADYALLYFGAIAGGFIPLPSSAQLTSDEARFLLDDSGSAMVVVDPELALDLPDGVQVLTPDDVAVLRTGAPGSYAPTRADDPAYLVYTSGTTGRPKGVLHAHRSAWGRRPMYQGWYDLRSDDVLCHAGAFNWTYTLGVGLTDPWANGASSVVYNGPSDPTVWPRVLRRFGATLFAAVPGLYRQILKYNDPATLAALPRLRHGLVAGEALPTALADEWRAATGTELYEALGMSEISTFVSSSPSVPVRPGSPGRPQEGRCVVAIGADGGTEPLPAGATGLVAVHRSDPGLMLGYWNRPDEEAAVFRGEWFVGGDLGSFDADGYLRYGGRYDDVLTTMGYRVSPQEVEECLAHHPGVAEVAVTETRSEGGVALICAHVVRADDPVGTGLTEADLLAHAARHLARYKCPRQVRFVPALPRTANGKILRRALRR